MGGLFGSQPALLLRSAGRSAVVGCADPGWALSLSGQCHVVVEAASRLAQACF